MASNVSFRDTRSEGGSPASQGPQSGAALLRSHKAEAAGIGVVAVVVLVALLRSKGTSSSPSSSAPPAAGAGIATSAYAQPAGTYFDTSSSYDALEQQIGQLASQLSGQGPGSPTLSVASAPPATPGSPDLTGYTPLSAAELPTFYGAGGTPYVNVGGQWFPYQVNPAKQPAGGYSGIYEGTVFAGPPLPNEGQAQ